MYRVSDVQFLWGKESEFKEKQTKFYEGYVIILADALQREACKEFYIYEEATEPWVT